MKKDKRLRSFNVSIIVVFVLIIVAMSLVLTVVITDRCEKAMLSKTSALISADAIQLKLNINSYLDSIEGNVSLMFADDDIVKYDASTTTLDEYDRISIEDAVASRIVDIGLLQNYSDFCVVYANDNTVGWKSKTTQSMYKDGGLYEDVSSYVSNDKTMDGWVFGLQDNTDRMYYVKRYNPNAVILTSFYTRELENTFEYPEELKGMTVRLADTNGRIVYSSALDEIGQEVEEEYKAYLNDGKAISAVNSSWLINADFCENGWMVLCTVDKDIMMQDFYSLRRFTYIFSGIIMIIALAMSCVMMSWIFKPMDGYVDDLSTRANVDLLSGVLTRRGYEDSVRNILDKNLYESFAFIMLDIDNFKKINDTWGHDYGDEVIKRMGALLNRIVVETEDVKPISGRLGGDEFTIFLGFNNADADKTDELLKTLLAEFNNEYKKEKESIPLSLSGGVVKSNQVKNDYMALYNAADLALYTSKESGKDKYTYYKEEMSNENK